MTRLEGIEHAFVHRLRKRRVREDRVHQVFLGGFELHGNDEPWINSVTSAPTICAPKSWPLLGIEDGLHQALVFAERDGLAVADERESGRF